jgi:hypothetical protein
MVERLVSLIDVDNTLLDNDSAKVELGRQLVALRGETGATAFWEAYEAVRAEASVVDIPRAIHRTLPPGSSLEERQALADLFMRFPFADYIYSGAREVIAWLRERGPVVILSDGDPVFQPNKINRAGLSAAVDGHVLVYIHKEEHLIEISAAFPASRYLLIDDKPGVIKRVTARQDELGAPLETILVRQGKYAATVPEGNWPGATWTCSTIADVRSVPIK